MDDLLERITALAWPAFDRSARELRRRAHPEWDEGVPNEVVVELSRERSDPDLVNAMPMPLSIFGCLVLDESWLENAERTGLLAVGVHFVLEYVDGSGRAAETGPRNAAAADGVRR